MMNGEIPEFRDILFMTLATHPDNLKDKPELLRKVAQVFTEATKILKTEPQRAKAILAKEYPNMTAETNEQAFATVSQIWPLTGQMTEAQARATFAYLQPEGPVADRFSVDLHQRFPAEVRTSHDTGSPSARRPSRGSRRPISRSTIRRSCFRSSPTRFATSTRTGSRPTTTIPHRPRSSSASTAGCCRSAGRRS